jgi:hypothetical protein
MAVMLQGCSKGGYEIKETNVYSNSKYIADFQHGMSLEKCKHYCSNWSDVCDDLCKKEKKCGLSDDVDARHFSRDAACKLKCVGFNMHGKEHCTFFSSNLNLLDGGRGTFYIAQGAKLGGEAPEKQGGGDGEVGPDEVRAEEHSVLPESKVPDAIEAGCSAATSLIKAGQSIADKGTLDVKSTVNILDGVSSVIGFVVPPPAGLVASSLIGLAGGVLSLFGDKTPSVTNEDVLNALQKGFDEVQQSLSKIDLKLNRIGHQLEILEDEVEQLIEFETLQANAIGHILAASSDLQRRFKEATEPTFEEVASLKYIRQLKHFATTFESESSNGGAASADNVNKVFQTIIAPLGPVTACKAGDFYKQILAARFALYHIVDQDNWFAAGEVHKNKTELMKSRGRLAEETLKNLQQDLKAFQPYVLAQKPEARLRWELGQGETCSTPVVGPGAMMTTRLKVIFYPDPFFMRMCFKNAPSMDSDKIEMVFCTSNDQLGLQPPRVATHYNGQASFIDPWSAYATNNPGKQLGRLNGTESFGAPTLCMKVSEIIHESKQPFVKWAKCENAEASLYFKAVGSTKEPFQLKAASLGENGCAYIPTWDYNGPDADKYGPDVAKYLRVGKCNVDTTWTMQNLVRNSAGRIADGVGTINWRRPVQGHERFKKLLNDFMSAASK